MTTTVPLEAAATRLVDALLSGDVPEVDAIVEDILDEHGPIAFFDDVLRPALYEVGARWARKEISVADEHLATALAHRQLAKAYPLLVTRPAFSREPVLLMGVQGELHVLGLRMIADVLEGAGFAVHFAGADVPTQAIKDAVRRLEPAVVGLSTTIGTDPEAVLGAIDTIREARPQTGILVGGARAAAAERHRDVQAIQRAGDALAAVEAIVAKRQDA